MRFSTSAILSALLGAAAVTAETFEVLVGKDAGLTFQPSVVNAKVGDVISFQFLAKNHTVTQSTFASPCVPKADGVDSGYQFVPGGASTIPAWSITINNASAPLWFFCAQGPHCKAGMVFAVNPTAEKTFDAFKASAAAGGGAVEGPNAATGAPPAASSTGPAPAASNDPAPAGNAGASLPSPDASGSTANQQTDNQIPGSALSGRSVQTGWALAGVMTVAALLL